MADAKDAIGATARIFWLYQAVALATSLLAFLPDRSSTYTDAINELRRLESIQIRPNDVDKAIAKTAYDAAGKTIYGVIREAASIRQVAMAGTMQSTSTYFWVDSGPQSLDFSSNKVRDILDALQAYRSNPAYTIFSAKPDMLKSQLEAKLAGQSGTITRVSLPCNYAGERCQAEISVNPRGDDVGAENILQFYVPRVATTLKFGVKDLINQKYPDMKDVWLEAPTLSRIQDEIAELAPAQAIAKLQDMRKGEEKPLSVFDVSLSGTAARLVAPVILALLAFAAWVSATGLTRVKLAATDIAGAVFLPLIDTPPAAILRTGLFVFPIAVGEGLFLRAWAGGTASGVIALLSIVLQAAAAVGIHRNFAEIRSRHITTGRDSKALAALTGITVLACGIWVATHPQRSALAGALPRTPVVALPKATPPAARPRAEMDAEEKEIRELQRRESAGE